MRRLASFRSLVWCCVLVAASPAPPPSRPPGAEDGYDLWLRYRLVGDAGRLAEYRAALTHLVVQGDSPTLRAAHDEMARGLTGLLGADIPSADLVRSDGALIAGTPATSRLIAALPPPVADELTRAGDEGFVLRALRVQHRQAIVIAANRDIGVLYGAFALLRLIQTDSPLRDLAVVSAPHLPLGRLATADPFDPAVSAWWRGKVDEIYHVVPDFGGFVVKANSEGQPGPQDYHRTHADGANLLADALRPYGGMVMWRAFVYANQVPTDRVRQAYDEFVPLDGRFRDNVLVQVKNGPLDFQPREPFHPLFGAMPRTPLMMEVQITKEYLGQDTHLAFLAPMWEEVLRADTYSHGAGSTVARQIRGLAGVANIGSDRDWCGSDFNQANWYAFGRLAWDDSLSSAAIADEWIRMTFSNDRHVVDPVKALMLASREAVVNYMTPLGLAHQMARGHHYGPGPWVSGGRADQTSVYFNRADSAGLGFDRTASGSNGVGQYFPPVRNRFASRDSVPETLLLWFHHVRWNERLRSGSTLWEELLRHYEAGVDTVRWMERTWDGLEGLVDAERFRRVQGFLRIQDVEARWWRDASVAYWESFSHLPLPPGYEAPAHPLDWYRLLRCPPDPRKPRCAVLGGARVPADK